MCVRENRMASFSFFEIAEQHAKQQISSVNIKKIERASESAKEQKRETESTATTTRHLYLCHTRKSASGSSTFTGRALKTHK